MLDKINSTNSMAAMCPQCKKQITVNPSEEVVFCSFCNKPFSVNDAIKQYNEYLERSKAAKKPSNEAIKKFNTILAQDYTLAEKYLEDIINKEYSQESKKYILFKNSSYSSLCSISNLDTLSKDRIGIEKTLNNIHSVNPCIAEMYYKILCASVNNMMSERNYDYNCNGELAFLKIQLRDAKERFSSRLKFVSGQYVSDYKSLFGSIIKIWNAFVLDIAQCKCWLQQEYDDEYIEYAISKIKDIRFLSVEYREGRDTWYGVSEITNYFHVGRALDANHIILDNVIKMLEEFYTPIQREKAKKEREESARKRKEEERLEKEKKYKEAFDKEVIFWNDYITLLKTKKIEKAYELIKTKYTKAHNSEIAKFKKGLFRFKYLGDVSMLQAGKLAELSVEDLK